MGRLFSCVNLILVTAVALALAGCVLYHKQLSIVYVSLHRRGRTIHRYRVALHRPNIGHMEFREFALAHLILQGEHYAEEPIRSLAAR